MQHLEINHWAVLVSGVILWLLGAIWYSPALFAKPWMEMLGIKKDESKRSWMMVGMISSFIGDLILSFVLAHVIGWAEVSGFGYGALVGCLVWIGFFRFSEPASEYLRGSTFQALRDQQSLLAGRTFHCWRPAGDLEIVRKALRGPMRAVS